VVVRSLAIRCSETFLDLHMRIRFYKLLHALCLLLPVYGDVADDSHRLMQCSGKQGYSHLLGSQWNVENFLCRCRTVCVSLSIKLLIASKIVKVVYIHPVC
jgi:hypothetical protein